MGKSTRTQGLTALLEGLLFRKCSCTSVGGLSFLGRILRIKPRGPCGLSRPAAGWVALMRLPWTAAASLETSYPEHRSWFSSGLHASRGALINGSPTEQQDRSMTSCPALWVDHVLSSLSQVPPSGHSRASLTTHPFQEPFYSRGDSEGQVEWEAFYHPGSGEERELTVQERLLSRRARRGDATDAVLAHPHQSNVSRLMKTEVWIYLFY